MSDMETQVWVRSQPQDVAEGEILALVRRMQGEGRRSRSLFRAISQVALETAPSYDELQEHFRVLYVHDQRGIDLSGRMSAAGDALH